MFEWNESCSRKFNSLFYLSVYLSCRYEEIKLKVKQGSLEIAMEDVMLNVLSHIIYVEHGGAITEDIIVR